MRSNPQQEIKGSQDQVDLGATEKTKFEMRIIDLKTYIAERISKPNAGYWRQTSNEVDKTEIETSNVL